MSVNFATADRTANAIEDDEARSGVLSFAAGETSKTIAVSVKGDRTSELQEVFYVNLSNASGAFAQNGQGSGVIQNDDR